LFPSELKNQFDLAGWEGGMRKNGGVSSKSLFKACASGLTLFCLITAFALAEEVSYGWQPLFDRTMRAGTELKLDPSDMASILVETGDPAKADEYYKKIEKKINFDIRNSHLDGLLEYLGYKGFARS
jgi:hypothetical protein